MEETKCENCGTILCDGNYCHCCGVKLQKYTAEDGTVFYSLFDLAKYEWERCGAEDIIILYDENLNKFDCIFFKNFVNSLKFAKYICVMQDIPETLSYALYKTKNIFQANTPYSKHLLPFLIVKKGLYRQRYIMSGNGKFPTGYEYLDKFSDMLITGLNNIGEISNDE